MKSAAQERKILCSQWRPRLAGQRRDQEVLGESYLRWSGFDGDDEELKPWLRLRGRKRRRGGNESRKVDPDRPVRGSGGRGTRN